MPSFPHYVKNFSSKSTLYSCGVDFLFAITQSAAA
nr:MAG TPA: hypothetical protein [Caudoviricetes sp.]